MKEKEEGKTYGTLTLTIFFLFYITRIEWFLFKKFAVISIRGFFHDRTVSGKTKKKPNECCDTDKLLRGKAIKVFYQCYYVKKKKMTKNWKGLLRRLRTSVYVVICKHLALSLKNWFHHVLNVHTHAHIEKCLVIDSYSFCCKWHSKFKIINDKKNVVNFFSNIKILKQFF